MIPAPRTSDCPRTAAFLAEPVTTRPSRVVAGGRVWVAAEDDQPLGARIGFDAAVELGQAAPAERSTP